MVEQDGAALPPAASDQGDVGANSGNEEWKQLPPFFSMCQLPVIYPNPWGAVHDEHELPSPGPPSSTETEPPSMLYQIDEKNKQSSSPSACNNPDFLESEPNEEHSELMVSVVLDVAENIWDVLSTEIEQPSSPILSSKQLDFNSDWDGKYNQDSSNQANSSVGLEDLKNKQPPSPSFIWQLQSVGAGLWNMGNTCFLNATLQCITHTVPLLMTLCSTNHSIPCPCLLLTLLHDYAVTILDDGFCSFCALKEHAGESIKRSGSILMPSRFTDNLSKISSNFKPGQQEDAHEFLRSLLDHLHKCSLNPESKSKSPSFDEDSIVKQVFGGRLRSQLSCCECGHCSETFEPFLDLSLEIDPVNNLIDALGSFTKVEQIGYSEDKLTCESCNAQVFKKKQLTLDKLPNVIVFQLKRFTTLGLFIEKIDKHILYPSELDLKPFHSNPDSDEELTYSLYGIVEHIGLPNYGHYVCTIRSSPTTWYLMNDSFVSSIDETDALDQQAYILFYVRQGLSPSPWFSSLLDIKEALCTESTTGASPVSVLDNLGRNSSTSSGEASNNSSGDKLEKDEGSPCIASSLDNGVAERSLSDAADSISLEQVSTSSPLQKRLSEDIDDEGTPSEPSFKLKPKGKKARASAACGSPRGPCLNKNKIQRLINKDISISRRKCLLECMLTNHDVEQE